MIIWLPILWMATGICLFAGIHFLHAGRSLGSAWLFPVFGVLSLMVAVYVAISALLQTPLPMVALASLQRLHVAVACAIYPVAMAFVSLYSRLRTWRTWVLGSTVVFGLLLILDMVGSHGLLLSNLHVAPPLELPWGERINQYTGTSAAFAPGYYVATLGVFCWAFWRCGVLWRHDDARRALPLAVYLVLQLIATGHAEYATLHGWPSLDWVAIPFLVLVLLVSRSLSVELRASADELNSSNAALREENCRRTQAQERLRHMACHDVTSQLPNRYALNDHLDDILTTRVRRKGALIVVDPERFGVVNHALGHRVGDLFILEIGKRLSRVVADEGYVARLNGDEFAVVLTTPPLDDAAALGHVLKKVQRIRKCLAQPFLVGTHALSLSACIGLTMFRQADGDSETLLRQAYAAVNAARDAGHNELRTFTRSMQAGAERKLRLENDLRIAIGNKQLHLEYQPQVDCRGCLVGAEALLRWEHPVEGPIDPHEFVQMAEDSGQMHALGMLVMRTAFSALRMLPARDGFRLSVNISPWQLFLPDFLDTVKMAIRDAEADPQRITLEITETAFIHNIADATMKIRALDAMGIRVAIDDFGTGYASIASLKAFPVHELKIDQAFIRDMCIVPPDRFVGAMIALARALDLLVVAEGVEHETQRQTLIEMGCDLFQGYLISRSVRLDELACWLRDGVPA